MKQILDTINKHFTKEHLAILFLMLVIAIILFIVFLKLYQRRAYNIKKAIAAKRTIRHLEIDLLNKTIYMYTLEDLKNARKILLKDFLSHYAEKDATSLNRWFLNQLNNKTSDSSYKEIITYSKKKKTSSKEIFVCKMVNIERHTLHVDCYETLVCPYIKADYEIERCFFKLKTKAITEIGLISFFVTNDLLKDKTKLNIIQTEQILEKICKYSNNKHLLTVYKNGDIGLIILNQKNGSQDYLNKLKNEISVYLDVNDFKNVSFNIALIKIQGNQINYNDCMKKVRLLANYLIDNKVYTPEIVYYSSKEKYVCQKKLNYYDRVKCALIKKEFIPKIIPFFYSKDGKVAFHKITIKPKDETLGSIDEIKNVVLLNSLQKEYTSMLLSTIDTCYSSVQSPKELNKVVLLKTSYDFVISIINNLDDFKKYPYTYILSISNLDFESDFDESYINNLKLIKDANIKLAIELNSLQKPRNEILALMDYVVLDESSATNFFTDRQAAFLLSNLLTYFKSVKLPIVAFNIGDWSVLESMICNFASIVSAKCLEQEEKISLGLDKRIVQKLKDIYYKYH